MTTQLTLVLRNFDLFSAKLTGCDRDVTCETRPTQFYTSEMGDIHAHTARPPPLQSLYTRDLSALLIRETWARPEHEQYSSALGRD